MRLLLVPVISLDDPVSSPTHLFTIFTISLSTQSFRSWYHFYQTRVVPLAVGSDIYVSVSHLKAFRTYIRLIYPRLVFEILYHPTAVLRFTVILFISLSFSHHSTDSYITPVILDCSGSFFTDFFRLVLTIFRLY